MTTTQSRCHQSFTTSFMQMTLLCCAATASPIIAAASPAEPCVKIGLLGHFGEQGGSVVSYNGVDLVRAAQLSRQFSSARIAGSSPGRSLRCFEEVPLEIGNTSANIDGLIREGTKQGIRFFVGLVYSNEVRLAERALEQTQSFLFSPEASSSEFLTETSRVALLSPNNQHMAKIISRELTKRRAGTLAIIYSNHDNYSLDMYRTLEAAYQKAGKKVFAQEISDFRKQAKSSIEKMRSLGVTHLFAPIFELESARLFSHLRRERFRPTIVGDTSWGSSMTILKSILAEDEFPVLSTEIYNSLDSTPVNQWFTKHFQKNWSKSPRALSAMSFDAINVLRNFSATCLKSTTPGQLRPCLKRAYAQTHTISPISFDKGLSARRDLKVVELNLGANYEH